MSCKPSGALPCPFLSEFAWEHWMIADCVLHRSSPALSASCAVDDAVAPRYCPDGVRLLQ